MAARSRSAVEGATGGRRLPDGVSGMLIVGLLRHMAPSTRTQNQLIFDVETIDADGRVSIESMSGWMMESGGTGAFTALGNAFASGELGPLVGQDVCVQVSARAAATKTGARLFITAEALYPLDAEDAGSGGDGSGE